MPDNSADNDNLNPGGFTLPAYVLSRPEGVYINLSTPQTKEVLRLFIDRLFSNEARFAGLDYEHFSNLLYGNDSSGLSAENGVNPTPGLPVSIATEVRIASSIVRFPPERMELYKDIKIINNGERAEYMFEPVFIEEMKDEPVYGEPGEDGVLPVIETRQMVDRQPTQLDFDEFVASMWVKGLRCGIDADKVRETIRKDTAARMEIAFRIEPTDSKDAEVIEESDLLHQDKSPLILPDGKADLRRARNRFPQVAKDTPLLLKIPRALGKPGYGVDGTVIEPRMPEDLDLSKFSGAGTRIDQTPRGELIVANIDGFVDLDESTGTICVTTTIEDKGGISAKLTGDIKLTVDDFTEQGEVQEGRIVEGKHMTFNADVFGTVISKGGNIELGSRLSGGRAQSIGGDITVKGKALNATVETWDGKINIEFAEDSLIMGKSVSIVRAVNCEIIAEELQLGIAEGCAIAGKQLQITSSNMHKDRETVISILIPDIASYDRQIDEAKNSLLQIEQAIQAKNREVAANQSDPGFARYLAMVEKVRGGEIQFTPEQQIGWKKIINHFAPLVRGTEGMKQKCVILGEAIKHWTQLRETCGSGGEFCKIEQVLGDTLVREMKSNLGMSVFRSLPEEELRSRLQELGNTEERIFWDDKGNIDWQFTVPEAPADSA